MTTTSATTISYEVTAIVAGSLKESEQKAAIEKIQKEIEKAGKVTNSAVWSSRPLAYKIQKEITGTYAIFIFAGEPDKIPELENTLRLDPKVIRYLIVKTPKNYKWTEYTAEDLEADYQKVNRDLFNEDEEKPRAKKAISTKPVVKKVAPAAKAKTKPVEKRAASKEEIDSKLDDIISDL
jgi:small subunit ribosomal protein S6